ncbi:MAG: acyltransferase [Candidatus Sumerlaeia bacterium]|nr:acyltransferase [Candidatus Sumerlaeia bacterium]
MKPPYVHPTAVVDQPCALAPGVEVWHFTHVREGASLGAAVRLGQNVYVGKGVRVGAGSKVQNNVSLYEAVELEEEVFCGPSCVFTNVVNPRAAIERKDEFRPTLVRRGATIGANATILCGHTIGRWAMVGAGAVVTGDVPDFALMLGVPARRAGWVSREGHRLEPDTADPAVLRCPVSGGRYRLVGAERLEPLEADPPLKYPASAPPEGHDPA